MYIQDVNLEKIKLSKEYREDKKIENIEVCDIERLLNSNLINVEDLNICELNIEVLYKLLNHEIIKMKDISKEDMKILLKKLKLFIISDILFLVCNFTFSLIILRNILTIDDSISEIFMQSENFIPLIVHFCFLVISATYIDYHMHDMSINQKRKKKLKLELDNKKI